ncbi:MAG: hypothetical protein MdMp024_1659 [Bacteroidales bacterium]
MKTLKLTSLMMVLLMASATAQEAFMDDVYFSSGKNKTAEEKQTVAYATPVTTATTFSSSGDRDVDEYNRRYASASDAYYDEDTVVIQNNQRTSDTEYSERIIRYHSPSKITIAGADKVDLYLSDGYYAYSYDTDYSDGGANVNFSINVGNGWGSYYGWYDPWYYGYSPWFYRHSPWYYSSWGWNWGWGGFYAGFYDPWYYPGYYGYAPYRYYNHYYYPHYSGTHKYAPNGRTYGSAGRSSGSQRQYSEGATKSRRSSTSSPVSITTERTRVAAPSASSSSRSSGSTAVAPSHSRSSSSGSSGRSSSSYSAPSSSSSSRSSSFSSGSSSGGSRSSGGSSGSSSRSSGNSGGRSR